jgi:hypothetical protein
MKRFLLLPALLLCFAFTAKAGVVTSASMHSDTLPRYYMELVPRVAFLQGWRSMLDVSIALRIEPIGAYPFTSHSITTGVEWNYGVNKYLLGFKAGYTYLNEIFDFSGFTAGGSVVYFPDRTNSGLYLQPQIAYEIIELAELMAQYNMSINAPAIDYRVNRFSVGLRIWLR